jgi:hypothetical protein
MIMMDNIGIYNHKTNENIVKEMTIDEIELRKKEIAEYQQIKTKILLEAENSQLVKKAALEKLKTLGITDEELKALGIG